MLAKVKETWIKVGYFILNNKSLVKNLSNLEDKYSKLKNHEKRGPAADLAQLQDFKVYLSKIFWADILDLRNKIKNEKKDLIQTCLRIWNFWRTKMGKEDLCLDQKIRSTEKKYALVLNKLTKKMIAWLSNQLTYNLHAT